MAKKVKFYLPWVIIAAALAGLVCALPIDAAVNARHYAWYWWLLIAGVAVILLTLIMIWAVKINRLARAEATAVGVTHEKRDVILSKNTTYTVADGKKATIPAGEYLLLAVDESARTFNLRVNNQVREYRHNSKMVLTNGDAIAAVSGNVILRRA